MKLFYFVNFPVVTCQKSIALTQNFSCVYIQPYFFKVFFTFWKKFKTWYNINVYFHKTHLFKAVYFIKLVILTEQN